MTIFTLFSIFYCIITNNRIKDRIDANNVQGFYVGHIVVLCLVVASIILSIGNVIMFFIGVIVNGLLSVWHIKLIKRLSIMKVEFLKNSVCYCRGCGAAQPSGTEFCTQCGTQIIGIEE